MTEYSSSSTRIASSSPTTDTLIKGTITYSSQSHHHNTNDMTELYQQQQQQQEQQHPKPQDGELQQRQHQEEEEEIETIALKVQSSSRSRSTSPQHHYRPHHRLQVNDTTTPPKTSSSKLLTTTAITPVTPTTPTTPSNTSSSSNSSSTSTSTSASTGSSSGEGRDNSQSTDEQRGGRVGGGGTSRGNEYENSREQRGRPGITSPSRCNSITIADISEQQQQQQQNYDDKNITGGGGGKRDAQFSSRERCTSVGSRTAASSHVSYPSVDPSINTHDISYESQQSLSIHGGGNYYNNNKTNDNGNGNFGGGENSSRMLSIGGNTVCSSDRNVSYSDATHTTFSTALTSMNISSNTGIITQDDDDDNNNEDGDGNDTNDGNDNDLDGMDDTKNATSTTSTTNDNGDDYNDNGDENNIHAQENIDNSKNADTDIISQNNETNNNDENTNGHHPSSQNHADNNNNNNHHLESNNNNNNASTPQPTEPKTTNNNNNTNIPPSSKNSSPEGSTLRLDLSLPFDPSGVSYDESDEGAHSNRHTKSNANLKEEYDHPRVNDESDSNYHDLSHHANVELPQTNANINTNIDTQPAMTSNNATTQSEMLSTHTLDTANASLAPKGIKDDNSSPSSSSSPPTSTSQPTPPTIANTNNNEEGIDIESNKMNQDDNDDSIEDGNEKNTSLVDESSLIASIHEDKDSYSSLQAAIATSMDIINDPSNDFSQVDSHIRGQDLKEETAKEDGASASLLRTASSNSNDDIQQQQSFVTASQDLVLTPTNPRQESPINIHVTEDNCIPNDTTTTHERCVAHHSSTTNHNNDNDDGNSDCSSIDHDTKKQLVLPFRNTSSNRSSLEIVTPTQTDSRDVTDRTLGASRKSPPYHLTPSQASKLLLTPTTSQDQDMAKQIALVSTNAEKNFQDMLETKTILPTYSKSWGNISNSCSPGGGDKTNGVGAGEDKSVIQNTLSHLSFGCLAVDKEIERDHGNNSNNTMELVGGAFSPFSNSEQPFSFHDDYHNTPTPKRHHHHRRGGELSPLEQAFTNESALLVGDNGEKKKHNDDEIGGLEPLGASSSLDKASDVSFPKAPPCSPVSPEIKSSTEALNHRPKSQSPMITDQTVSLTADEVIRKGDVDQYMPLTEEAIQKFNQNQDNETTESSLRDQSQLPNLSQQTASPSAPTRPLLNLIVPTASPSPFETSIWNMPNIVILILTCLGDPAAVCYMKRVNTFCSQIIRDNEYMLMKESVRIGGLCPHKRPSFWMWITLEKFSPPHMNDQDDDILALPSIMKNSESYSEMEDDVLLNELGEDDISIAEEYVPNLPQFTTPITQTRNISNVSSKTCEVNELERIGREGKWHNIIMRDVRRSFGNLPPHKSSSRSKSNSIVRALVSWGQGHLLRRKGNGDCQYVVSAPSYTESEKQRPIRSLSMSSPPVQHQKIAAKSFIEETNSDTENKTVVTVSDWGGVSPVNSTVSSVPTGISTSVNELVLSGNALTSEMKMDLQNKLEYILNAIAAAHQGFGYCQGMDYVVAHLLRILQETIEWNAIQGKLPKVIRSHSLASNTSVLESNVVEETVFRVMDTFLETYNLRHMYWPELRCLKTYCRIFQKIVEKKLPVLADHFEYHELNIGMFALGWFQTLYLYLPSMPSATINHIWDIWIVERSMKIFFRVGIAILFLSQPILLNHELEGMMTYLNTFPDATLLRHDILIRCALQIKITNQMLEDIELTVARENELAHGHSIQSVNMKFGSYN